MSTPNCAIPGSPLDRVDMSRLGLTSFEGHPPSRVRPGRMSRYGERGEEGDHFISATDGCVAHGLRNEMIASKLYSTKRLHEQSRSHCFLGFQWERSSASMQML